MRQAKLAGIAALIWLGLAATAVPGLSAQVPTAQTTANAQPKVVGFAGNLEADDLISLEVEHLAEWAAANNPAKLVPYVNGLAIHGNYPEEIHASKNRLHFHLQITPESKQVWVDLLGTPKGVRRPVTLSVGLENQSPFDTVYGDGNTLPLTVISPAYGVIAFALVMVTLIVFVWLAKTTNIIRQPGPRPAAGKLRPYNLGRAQMAFWFFLIYASYVAIWLTTSALDTITASVLALMGISAGTALSEALIDSGKDAVAAGKVQDVTAEKLALEQSIAELQSQIADLQARPSITPEEAANRDNLGKQLQDSRTRLAQLGQQLQELSGDRQPGVSVSFLRDILSDGNGYSFHRFQIFAWTIVLGVIFVSSVYNGLTMPEFSSSLLGLMGISSGTYIGFKFPEQKQQGQSSQR